jgi:hypothetical protein
MTDFDRLATDLRFVRSVLASNERVTPASIYFLWAAASLIGFALIDLDRHLVGPYWAVVAPVGFVVSLVLGRRHGHRTGEVSAAHGWRQAWHWGGMLAAIALAAVLPARGLVPWEVMNAVFLLILALGYFTAGVHGDRGLMWVGALMGAGSVLLVLVPAYAWTALGVVLAAALVTVGVRGGRAVEAAP